jgi:hypothetical protein
MTSTEPIDQSRGFELLTLETEFVKILEKKNLILFHNWKRNYGATFYENNNL